jgi:hypothetical protein
MMPEGDAELGDDGLPDETRQAEWSEEDDDEE